jgi:hypothetical protein
VVGDDHAEDRVTEELEALVRVVPRVLRTPRPVDEGGRERLGAVDGDTQPRSQFVESVDGECYGDALLP